MSWPRKPVSNNTRWFKDIYSYPGGPWIPFIFLEKVTTVFCRFSSRSFLLQKNHHTGIFFTAKATCLGTNKTVKSITDGEGGNWPDFQRRLNPRLSESRPSLVGKRRRLSKSWHRPNWNFPCTIESWGVVSCNTFWELCVTPRINTADYALSILLCTVNSGDIILCDLF